MSTYYRGQPSFVASFFCSNCGVDCQPSVKACPSCKESPNKSNLVREGKGFRKSWDKHDEEEES